MGRGISIKCSSKKCSYTKDLQEGWGFLSCNEEIALKCFKGANKVTLRKHLENGYEMKPIDDKIFYCKKCGELTTEPTFILVKDNSRIRSKHFCKKCGEKLYMAKINPIKESASDRTSPLTIKCNKQEFQYHCPKCGADKFIISFFLWD